MMNRCCVFLCALLLSAASLFAQTALVTPQQPLPPSSALSLPVATTVTLPQLDNAAFIAEDQQEYEAARVTGDMPPARIARPQEVHLTLNNSGSWETLPNGDRVWRLRIVSPGATDLFIQYDQWRLVKPCELYLYNDDRSMVLGPYTSVDNWDGTNITPITKGEAVTLEYWVPADQEDIGELSILRVGHGYRHFHDREETRENNPLDNFGDSMPCMININCFPSMQEEKHAVAMIIDPMGGACSGTMLNNVPQNGDPLFLTANHCLTGNQSNWLFYFNYESPQCSPNQDGTAWHVISNATLLMNHALTDHALLRLSRSRPDTPFIPAFMGWYRPDIAASSSYGIHHPAADVKKGHEDYDPATSTDWNGVGPNTHWLTHIDNGMMEPGSSGSPMINTGGYVVGPLHGGSWDCDGNTVNDAKYGKLSVAWEGGGGSSSRLRDWLDPNSSGANFQGYWQPQGPPNDSCGQPGLGVITSLPFSQSGSTQFAANNFNSTGGCAANNSPEVIWFLELPCDHQVTVSSCGSGFDTQIFVYQVGTCLDVYSMPGCNDDFAGCGLQSQVTFDLWGGYRYMIVLEGFGSAAGNYVMNITGFSTSAQGNAQCPGYVVDQVPYFIYGANYCGNDDVNPTCQSNDGEDVHWYWVSPFNQVMRAKTCYSNFDTILEVRYGGACPGDWLAACNDDNACGGDWFTSQAVWDANAGTTYYFHVDGYSGAQGITSFEVEAWNDNCATPYVIPSLPFNDFGDTRPARDDFETLIGPSSKDLFFQYTSPICQNMGVSLCGGGTAYDSYVEVRTGGPCPGSSVVTYNDDFCGLASQATWSAEANRTYYIIVAGYGTNEGPFSIQFYNIPGTPGAPLGDVCPGLNITSLPFTDYGNTCCMVDNYEPCGFSSSPEVVYQFSVPTCRTVNINTCGSNFDTKLAVYNGNCVDYWPLVGCNDDSYCGDTYTYQSTLSFEAQPFVNYQILLHGFSSYCGNYVLNITDAPCPVGPVDSLVILAAYPAADDVTLTWAPATNAVSYNIYSSSDVDNIVLPGNLLLNTGATTATLSGLTAANEKLFFQVEAVGAALMSVDETPELPKEMAEQGVIIENPNLNAVDLRNVEEASKNGK